MLLVNLKSPFCLFKKVIQEFLCYLQAESIECFIVDQAFLLSYELAPVTPPPLSPVIKLSLCISLPLCHRSDLLTGEGKEGVGVGEEPNHTKAR
jgi:hypothetical protein